MIQRVEAIYENGMFKPLEPVTSFAESELVELRITKKITGLECVPEEIRDMVVRLNLLDREILPVTLEEVRVIMDKIPLTAVEMIREDREARESRLL